MRIHRTVELGGIVDVGGRSRYTGCRKAGVGAARAPWPLVAFRTGAESPLDTLVSAR